MIRLTQHRLEALVKNKEVNLSYHDLTGLNLKGYNLKGANLAGSNLTVTNLDDSNLEDADLSYSILCKSSLKNAILKNADMMGADLRLADFENADLTGAELNSANLLYANLNNTNLENITTNIRTLFLSLQCPEEGSFIGYKVAIGNVERVIVKLMITEDAKRSSGTTRKCRCNKAKVLDITNFDGTKHYNTAHSIKCSEFTYNIGEIVESDFDENRWLDCGKGIHFFITRREAIDYSREI